MFCCTHIITEWNIELQHSFESRCNLIWILPNKIHTYTRGTTCNKDVQSTGKNPFSTDFYHLFKKIIYGWIYGFFLTRLGYYPFTPPPTPLHFQDSRFFALAVWTLFRLLKPPPPRPHCTFVTRGVPRVPRLTFFGFYPPGPIGFRNLRIFQNSDWATLL